MLSLKDEWTGRKYATTMKEINDAKKEAAKKGQRATLCVRTDVMYESSDVCVAREVHTRLICERC